MLLPIQSSKQQRHALSTALPAALDFLSHHLLAQRRVLIVCDDGAAHCLYFIQEKGFSLKFVAWKAKGAPILPQVPSI